MSAWKQFTTKDVTLTPFTADKGWNLTGSAMTGSDLGVNIYTGQDVDYLSNGNKSTGFVFTSSYNSIYNSVKQLYYTNYRSSSAGDDLTTASVITGVTREDDRLTGPIQSPLYDNYLQSSLTQYRTLKSEVSVISIPTKLFGERIMPYTFQLKYGNSLAFDDGEGNIIDEDKNIKGGGSVTNPLPGAIVGQIFYSQGMIVLTESPWDDFSLDIRNNEGVDQFARVGINFSSSLTIHENQYKCTILENEFGVSTNPSLLTASIDGADNTEYYAFATASFFEPYVTCVGLYNEAQQLVAVGKLSFPLPVSKFTDTTVIVNYDI